MKLKGATKRALRTLRKTYDLIGEAQAEFESTIRNPICIGCGSCCSVTSVRVTGLEAAYTGLWLSYQRQELYDEVLAACEEWVIREDPNLKCYGELESSEHEDRVSMEMTYLLMESSCPFVNEGRRCSIYPARPVICRLFGLTRITGPMCQSPTRRLYMDGKRSSELRLSLSDLPYQMFDYSDRLGFLPTLLFKELKPKQVQSYLNDNKIPTAKILPQLDTNLYWQEQMDEYSDREKEHDFLTNPIPA